jgi:hypothetical protein
MSAFDYKLKFCKGKENSNADCLSGLPIDNIFDHDEEKYEAQK